MLQHQHPQKDPVSSNGIRVQSVVVTELCRLIVTFFSIFMAMYVTTHDVPCDSQANCATMQQSSLKATTVTKRSAPNQSQMALCTMKSLRRKIQESHVNYPFRQLARDATARTVDWPLVNCASSCIQEEAEDQPSSPSASL